MKASHREYNVGYRDSFGHLRCLFRTPTHYAQARNRLKKAPVAYEFVEGGENIQHPTFLVFREISHWQAEE